MKNKINLIPTDTTIEAARKQFEILRGLDNRKRGEIAFQLSGNLRSIVEAGVRIRLGDCDEQKIRQEVIRLMIGDSLFKQIYRDDRG